MIISPVAVAIKTDSESAATMQDVIGASKENLFSPNNTFLLSKEMLV
jgi:hypothetical protein